MRERLRFVIQAFAGRRPRGRPDARDYGADAMLLDNPTPGSGEVFDWALAGEVPDGPQAHHRRRARHPTTWRARSAAVQPWGVDVVTGVEREPGHKDPVEAAGLRGRGPGRRGWRPIEGDDMAGPTTGRRTRDRRRRHGRAPGQTAASASSAGRYVPESLMPACTELEAAFRAAWADPGFHERYDGLLRDYAGRPTPVTECARLSERLGVRLLLKREDLTHTGSHKINNVLGQGLLTLAMGKSRMIAETGAGQHGVATATAAALFGLECVVYMGEVDTERQALNVFRMQLLGAEVRPVRSGSRTLKDAVNEAMRDWVASVETPTTASDRSWDRTPIPWMVREFQRVVGDEAQRQCRVLLDGGDPDYVVACVGGGSNAAGTFAGFVDTDAQLVGVEAAGGAAIGRGVPGVVHGMKSYLLQDEYGQVSEAHSISAGLDYPGVGPEHAHLASGRPGPLRAGRRRRGARRLAAAGPDRGDHPRPRAGPRPGLGDPGARPAASCRPARRCSSPCRAGATRTPSRSWACSTVTAAGGTCRLEAQPLRA